MIYNYGIGRLRGIDLEAMERQAAEQDMAEPDFWPKTNAEIAAEAAAQSAASAAAGAVAPASKQGMSLMGIDFMSPVGLGVIGAIGGYFAGKGRRAKTRYSLIGGLVGAAAAYFMKK
jgi:hypothetical protein